MRPKRITTDWNRSVSATDHMPPKIVYTTTIAAPIMMPVERSIEPPDSTQNTRPSAVSCAEVQPRYEAVMATLVITSTVLL